MMAFNVGVFRIRQSKIHGELMDVTITNRTTGSTIFANLSSTIELYEAIESLMRFQRVKKSG